MSHKLLHISSRDKDGSSESNSNFSVSFSNSDVLQAVKKITLKSVSIPNTVYNVNQYNNEFTYKIAGTPTSVTMDPGQYSQSEFKTEFETILSGLAMSIVIDPNTKRIFATTTTPIEWLTISENKMAEILGIETGSGGDVTFFNAQHVIALEGLRSVFIDSIEGGEGNMLSSRNSQQQNIIGIVPMTVGFGFIEHYKTDHSEIDDQDIHRGNPSGRNIQKISIKLLDEKQNVIDLNGHHVEMILKIHY